MGRDEQMKESILREFQKRGMRITKQRSMILDVILEKNGPTARRFIMRRSGGIRT